MCAFFHCTRRVDVFSAAVHYPRPDSVDFIVCNANSFKIKESLFRYLFPGNSFFVTNIFYSVYLMPDCDRTCPPTLMMSDGLVWMHSIKLSPHLWSSFPSSSFSLRIICMPPLSIHRHLRKTIDSFRFVSWTQTGVILFLFCKLMALFGCKLAANRWKEALFDLIFFGFWTLSLTMKSQKHRFLSLFLSPVWSLSSASLGQNFADECAFWFVLFALLIPFDGFCSCQTLFHQPSPLFPISFTHIHSFSSYVVKFKSCTCLTPSVRNSNVDRFFCFNIKTLSSTWIITFAWSHSISSIQITNTHRFSQPRKPNCWLVCNVYCVCCLLLFPPSLKLFVKKSFERFPRSLQV